MIVKILNEALAAAHGLKSGDVLKIDDINGTPKSKYWRRRVYDAEIDSAIEIVDPAGMTIKRSTRPKRNKKTDTQEA